MTEKTETSLLKQGLVPTGSKYTDEDRRKAVVLYMVLPTNTAVAKEIGCYQSTISRWRRTDWWEQERVRFWEIEEELRAILRKVALECGQLALDAARSKELGGKEAMIMSGIAYDKLRLSENRPTTISATSDGIG